MFSSAFLVLTSLSLLNGFIAAPVVARAGVSSPTATIANGRVVGVPTTVPGGRVAVNKWLGVPFAQSPPERFSPPVDAAKWTTPLKATVFKPACIQQFNYPAASRSENMRLFNNPDGAAPAESEDCLYLNVFAPATASAVTRSDTGLPVMVWIYGGNLQFGDGGIPFYDGSSFAANQGVVIVTFNYRTNAFGFSASPEIATGQQNSGFLDQRKALEWVQVNIKAFGGDPTKVTIFGESAGGFSVQQLVLTPPNPATFHAAIMESFGFTIPASPVAAWNSLVNYTDCTSAVSQIACVRAVPAMTIKSIVEENGLTFGPTEDSVTYVSNTQNAFITHSAAQIPLFYGSNANEGRVFAYLFGLDSDGNSTAQKLLEIAFPGQSALQAAVLALYPTSLGYTPYELLSQVITDLVFTCTTSEQSSVAALNGYNTWRYYFAASFPNTNLFPDAGAYHTSEIPEVFGTYPTAGATQQQIELSEFMQTAWANFAKNPTAGPGWPKLGSNLGVELGSLGADGSYGEVTVPLVSVDAVCVVYDPVIAIEPLLTLLGISE